MIGRLAVKSLTAHPVRTAVLAAGFGVGVAVMAILLGVAEIVLDQSRSPALVGGGLCLLRGRVRLAFAAATLLAVGVTLGSGQSNLALATPPPPTPVPETTSIRVGDVLLENVQVVVSPDWGDVKLTLPPSVAARLGKAR